MEQTYKNGETNTEKNIYVIINNYVENNEIVEQRLLGMDSFHSVMEAMMNLEIKNPKTDKIFIAPEDDYVVIREKERYGGQNFIVIERIEDVRCNKALLDVLAQGEIEKVKGKVAVVIKEEDEVE